MNEKLIERGAGLIKPIIQDEKTKETIQKILDMNSRVLEINEKIVGILTAVQFIAKEFTDELQ